MLVTKIHTFKEQAPCLLNVEDGMSIQPSANRIKAVIFSCFKNMKK